MVPQRPFLIGNPGCVRSSAWIWLFSSTQRTIACCGGFRYRPTTSVIFSRNFGSRDNLKAFVRWGCSWWARQILLTVDLLTPWLWAMVRQLQCVIPAGLVCRVAFTMAAILSISYPPVWFAGSRSRWRRSYRFHSGAFVPGPELYPTDRPAPPGQSASAIESPYCGSQQAAPRWRHPSSRQRLPQRSDSATPPAVGFHAPRSTAPASPVPRPKADMICPCPRIVRIL